VSRRDEVVRDPSERLCWLHNPVCLERREEAREEAPPSRLLAKLARKAGRALSRMLGVGPC
jgi:hypothetical protein